MKSRTKKKNLNGIETVKKKTKDVKTYILIGVGLTATGIAGYFGYQYYKKHKAAGTGVSNFVPPPVETENPYPSNNGNVYTPPYIPNNNTYTPPNKSKQTGSQNTNQGGGGTFENLKSMYENAKAQFPLKKGSKGILVKQLQEVLIAQHGKSILPKYGADGDFGNETVNALKKLKHPATVSESLYYVIVGTYNKAKQETANSNYETLAAQLLSALISYKYAETMNLLKKLKNTSDYSATSEIFKQSRVHGVRQTLVNGALSTFSDAQQKQAIRMEFIRMGLKYNGAQWSLSGVDNPKIITKETAQVWLDGYRNIAVPANTILGTPIAQKLDFTLFENNGRHFLVRTLSVRPL